MATPGGPGPDWTSLLQQTRDLVAQDFSGVPRVERSLPQLQQYADALRSRTNRYRSPAEQAAATRLLAQQGFDATRLTSDVTGLEIVPTIEDVFHAETNSVEEYLQQVEEATLLAAIQEAQQESVASFESYMEQCMARDWAANKRQLFGLIAPHSANGGYGALGGGLSQGNGPLIGRSAGGGGLSLGAPALRLSPKEAAYVEIVKKVAVAVGGGAAGGMGGLEVVREFLAACKAHEDKAPGHDTPISSIWSLLADVLAEARARGVTPSAGGGGAAATPGGAAAGGRYVDALAAGARRHLERGHAAHVRSTISRYKLAAERGADPDSLREVQAYIQVKFRDRGPLDFASPNGLDTSWVQLFYCLRSGFDAAARRAAERCGDLMMVGGGMGGGGGARGGMGLGSLGGGGGEGGMRQLVDEWLRNGCRLPDRTAAALSREAERLLRDKNGLRHSPRAPYQALTCALLAGDARSVDALGGVLQSLQLPAILSTIEDFMWAKLALVGASAGGVSGGSATSSAAGAAAGPSGSFSAAAAGLGGGGGGGAPMSGVAPYTLADLQADINRWPPQYYSKQNREPLLYVTVLLLSLQLGPALRFLWRDDTTKPYRLDAVHLGLALQAEGALAVLNGSGPIGGQQGDGAAAGGGGGGSATSDVASMALQYGRKFLAAGDSATALYYYWMAAAARGGGLAVKGSLLRELLSGGRDFGTLLGGGGAGARGALHALVPDAEERRRLFEGVAYECQMSAQPEEAVELYLAADRPVAALALINGQLSAAIAAAAEEESGAQPALGASSASERLRRIALRGAEAAARLSAAAGSSLTSASSSAAAAAASLPLSPLSLSLSSAPLAADPAARRELEAFQQLGVVRDMLLAAKRGRHDQVLQRLSELSFIPTERSRLDTCVRMSTQLHPAVAERLQDVIATAADSIAARRQAVGREAAAGLAAELAVLTQYANSMAGARLPQAVYRKLAEAQVYMA